MRSRPNRLNGETGIYTLLVDVKSATRVRVGRLGKFAFSGVYSYTGSALGNYSSCLSGRISRHLSVRKKVRWHIDYLLEDRKVERRCVISSVTQIKSKECEVSNRIFRLTGLPPPVRKFGSTDCVCESHLAYLGENLTLAAHKVVQAHEEAGLNPTTIPEHKYLGNRHER